MKCEQSSSFSDRDRRLDAGERVVVVDTEVVEIERVDVGDFRVEPERRQRARLTCELLLRLLEVVEVEVGVTASPDELARREPDDLRHHVRQRGVGRDVEWHAQEHVARTLVELAAQLAVGNIELEKRVARREGHLVKICHVPCVHDDPARVRITLQCLDHRLDLVDVLAVRCRPGAPLRTVDRSQVAVLISPLIPDLDVPLLQPAHVRVTAQEPDQLAKHSASVDLLRRHERKPLAQIEAHLMAEDTERASTCTVTLLDPLFEDLAHKVQVLLHLQPLSM